MKNFINDSYDSFKDEGFNIYYKDDELKNVIDDYKEKAEKYSKNKNKCGLKLSMELTFEQINEQAKSVQTAFIKRKLVFCDDLMYYHNIKEENCYNKMKKGTELSDSDKFVFYTCKQKMAKCIYPPFVIIHSNDGYAVKAIDNIDKYTFLCEYSGKVEINGKYKNEGDSNMILQNPSSNTIGLDIVPNVITNIARFISGINNKWNQAMKSKYKNVNSFKCEIEGFPHILLYAHRNIKKNEILYYNYNEGKKKEQSYNTDYFTEVDEID